MNSETKSAACFIVSYDHGGLVLWGYDHFLEHLRGLLQWLDRHPHFKSGLDNEAWMYDWLAENQPAVLETLRQALRKYAGRFAIGTCTYGQPLAAYILDESNIRQIRLGLETVRRRLGYELDIYSFSEHAAIAQMPQILSQLGIRGALMRTHYLMYGYCPGYDLPTAWWQGTDGSRVRCVPTYVKQERSQPGHRAHPPGPFGLTTEDTWILTRYPSEISPKPLDAFAQRFAHIRPLLATRIDDSGLRREQLVSELAGRSEFRFATLEEVFDEFPEPQVTVAPESEDFATRMPWGYRGNELFDLARQAETTLLTAERLAAVTLAGDSKRAAHVEAELEQAWKDALMAQHHDVQIVGRAGTLGRERLIISLDHARGVIRSLLRDVAPTQAMPDDFIAFNPLPFDREEACAALPDGTILAGEISAPAMGLTSFRPDGAEPQPAGLAFETEAYHVTFDAEGGLASLTDRAGVPLLAKGRRSGELAGLIEGEAYTSSGTVCVGRTSWGYHVTETGKIGPLPYAIAWRFPTRGTRIDYSVNVRFDGQQVGEAAKQTRDSWSCFVHEKKLRACFYPAVKTDAATGLHDVPFGVSTTRRPYVEGNFWTALVDDEGGLALFNRGTMGSCRETSGALSVPLAFATHYVWGDEMICGSRDWQLAIRPFRAHLAPHELHREALRFAFPIVAVPGTLAAQRPLLRIDNPRVHLTAMYLRDGVRHVRIYNGSDEAQQVQIPGAVHRTDLWDKPTSEVTGDITLRPWEIATVALRA